MQIVSCRKCGAHMDWQIRAEYVTAACICGLRIATQYIFTWKQIPTILRPHAIKSFVAHGRWRIQPLWALKHALQGRWDSEREHADAYTSAA